MELQSRALYDIIRIR